MMSDKGHTKTPWSINARASMVIENSDNRVVASCGGYSDNTVEDGGYGENTANAKHIVKCVNAHDGLVKALRYIASGGECSDDLTSCPNAEIASSALIEVGIEVPE